MLEYDRINISKGIDINKTNASKECKICHYWYFNSIQDGLFWGYSQMGRGGGGLAKRLSLPKICHTHPTVMKLSTVTTYLKKI